MPRGVRRLIRFALWIYLAYLLLSLLVVLPALNIVAPWAVREFLDRELRHELIVFNPFTVAVSARGVSIDEADGHRPLAFDKASVDLSMASLWRQGVVFDALRVERLDVHVLRYADGGFHFDDLLQGGDDSAESTALPALTVEDFYVDAHTLRFTDRTRRDTYSAAYSDFVVQTRDITTLPERRGNGRLAVRGADGGVVRWSGEIGIADGYSSGTLEIDRLDLTHVWRYQSEQLAFVTDSALVDLGLDYTVDWSDDLRFSVSDGRFRAHELRLVPADPEALPHTSAVIGDLVLDNIAVDSSAELAAIDSVSLRGLVLRGFVEGDRASPVDMFAPSAAAPADAATEDIGEAAQEDSWRLRIANLSVDDSRMEWRTNNLAPESMTMSPLRLTAADISWPAEGTSAFELGLTVNGQMQFAADGEIHLGDGDASIRYRLDQLPLHWINPVLNRSARADITDGLLSFTGEAGLREFLPARVGADLRIERFAAQIHGTEESALSFDELTVSGVAADVDGALLRVEDVALRSPQGALHILEDGSFNATSALIAADAPTPEATAGAEAGDEAEADAPGETAWGVQIGHIGIRDGRLDFSDASLPLPFQTLIGDIEADINDLDTRSETPLVATLNGAVDGYAPVVIEARGTPLADPRDASLTLSFRGMDIATMSPYSGTYAGYTIDSGTLSVDLRYGVQGSELDGDNRIVISQMELGEPIESERAMQLPLQLGIALLTDARGVIDLEVPISGDVSDPKFSLGGIIGRAIANVIIKAATAPFRLLAGLVNSEQDLENIVFAPGVSTLSDAGQDALEALAEALTQRPKLQLRVIGSIDPVGDRRALQAAALEQQLLASGLGAEAIAARDSSFQQAIDARYELLGIPAPEDGGEVALEDKLQTLQSRIELPPGTLQDLGTERATAAKRELVTSGGIDASRIAVAYDRSLLMSGVKMSLDG